MASTADPSATTVVVFDVNVYLDVADLLGPGLTLDAVKSKAAEVASYPMPYADERVDSLRAVSLATHGQVVVGEPLEVWSSDHIDALVVHKAIQPTDAVRAEDRGLGWDLEDANDMMEVLVRDLAYSTGGACLESIRAHSWAPPLDHEDGCVYQTAYKAGDNDSQYRMCVTRDGPFRNTALPPRVDVVHPHEFIQYVRDARRGPMPAGLRPL